MAFLKKGIRLSLGKVIFHLRNQGKSSPPKQTLSSLYSFTIMREVNVVKLTMEMILQASVFHIFIHKKPAKLKININYVIKIFHWRMHEDYRSYPYPFVPTFLPSECKSL